MQTGKRGTLNQNENAFQSTPSNRELQVTAEYSGSLITLNQECGLENNFFLKKLVLK